VGRLDVVVANAGIASDNKIVAEASQENMLTHFTVNVLGPMVLFQATYALLKASTSTPKFVPVSTTIASIAVGTLFPALQAEYGTSKAALNWMTRKLWAENEWLGSCISS
jgi:NAD(P)-dependent dehydrogenase (short-subunit alcohol dehydrogenase family)